jgi:hypothetical protein
MLPAEQNGPLFGIRPQPPDSQQVKTLNIYGDSGQADGTGAMSAMGLSGFGMSGEVDFRTSAFGEPLQFPGGITWGSFSINSSTGQFNTGASLSTVDIVNLMLGQGNDHLNVSGSLVPGPTLNDDGTLGPVAVHGGLTMVQGGGASLLQVSGRFDFGAGTITRDDGLPWSAYEFAVGQELLLNGSPIGVITQINGATLTIVGSPLAQGSGVRATVSVFGPKTSSSSTFTFAGNTITRADLRSWAEFGFAPGQQIAVDGVIAGTITGSAFSNVLTLSGASFGSSTRPATVAVFDPSAQNVLVGGNAITVTGGGGPGPGSTIPSVTGNFTATANQLIRTDGGSWLGAGFAYGDVVQIGANAYWTVSAISTNGSTLTLSGPALTPGSLTGVQVQAFAPSPLVVYGGTSQDGLFYSGDFRTTTLQDLGTKPFPNQLGEGTPDFVFGVATPFRYFGNNVIDASADFASVPDSQLPSVGITAYGGPGNDTIIGSQAGDFLAGGSGANTIEGERGANQIYGNDGVNVNVITRALTFPTENGSSYPSSDPLQAGANTLYAVYPGSTVSNATGAYNSVVIGGMGAIGQNTAEALIGLAIGANGGYQRPSGLTTDGQPLLERIQTTQEIRTIASTEPQNKANVTIYGGGSDSVLIGGSGSDSIDGGAGRALIFADNASLDRTNHLNNFTGPRWQDLQGTQIYGPQGQLLTDGNPQLNPNGHGWWGDFLITLLYTGTGANPAYTGNNYIAGGPGSGKMIFGEAGNDIIQGNGSIDIATAGAAASCLFNGYRLGNRVGACRDSGGNLLVNPSVANYEYTVNGSNNPLLLDGSKYIEGGPGDNTIFGDQGQNDIVGGSSDMFSATTPSLRASGSNLIFGGDGTLISRENPGDLSANGHAHNADVIIANNGDIVRLVGTNGQYGAAGPGENMYNGFLTFNYDVYGYTGATEHVIARGVKRLDFTPGGPDLAGQSGPLVTGSKATNGVGDIGGHPLPCNETAAQQALAPCQQQGSEIHVEAGDAFVYGGPANDVIFGGGQNDTIILGYGDNWVSGGRGDQCIIVGGGRCFASRVSSTYGEPLYGIAPIPAANINQLISTPGNAQQAVINVAGALQYTALLFPYNWDPSTWVSPGVSNNSPTFQGCTNASSCPLYQPRYGHNIIYGGWGGGVIHGGPGQSAISGAEAPVSGFANNYDMNGVQLNTSVIETDWYHPFNPGNPMGFNTTSSQLSYFDPNDPRREIMLNADGSLCKWTAPATGAGCPYNWFLNFNPNDPGLPLDNRWYQGTGHPQEPVTGDKAIFGDLGNDWLVAGMGRVRVYGGWGNDVIDLRASTQVDGGLNDGPVPNLDGTFGTPAWESLAYGGAGQDILFAGTGGDRLIDWVGEHNSYYVPFGPYGMPTVSRTLMPFLDTFLYALSKSDGADPTLGIRYGGASSRNGEPFGELGLVLQHDAAWHEQVGGPFNKMPENLGGVAIDNRVSAGTRPIHSPGTDPPAAVANTPSLSLPSGTGVNMPSGISSASASTTPIYLTGPAGASVSYTFTEGTTTVSGSGVIGPNGTFGGTVDLSAMPDGTINVTATLTPAGASATTLTATLNKNSVAPAAPTVSAPSYANIANVTTYNVTVTGQVGAIANVVITDSATPVPGNANGMDVVGSGGSVLIPIDASYLLDGPLTLSVTLTNGAGNSTATTLTPTKDTTNPPLSVSTPQYINNTNYTSFPLTLTGQQNATPSYSFTDGTNTVAATLPAFPAAGKRTANPSLSTLKDGTITLTVTEVEPSGNQTAVTSTIYKSTVAPTTPTVALNPASDSGASNSDYITNVTAPQFTVTGPAGTTPTVYVNGTLYTGQVLADGSYTVTATATDVYGSVSAAGTAPKTLVIATAAPTGSFSITGANSYNGQLYTNNKTPSLALSFTPETGTTMSTLAVSTNGGSTFGASQAYSSSVPVTLGADGTYTIVVKATDVAGNTATSSLSVVLSTVAPTGSFSITGAKPYNGKLLTNNKTPTLALSFSAAVGGMSTVAVSTNGGTTFGASQAYSSSVPVTLGADGTYTIVVKVTDVSGNSTTSSQTLVLDTTAPTGTLSVTGAGSYNGALYTNNKTPTLTLSFTDPGSGLSTMAVSTDGGNTFGATQPYASTYGLTLGADGTYTIVVKLTDVAGNTGTYSQTLVLNTAAPTGSFSIVGAQTFSGALYTNNKTPTLALAFTPKVGTMSTVAVSTNGGATFGTAQAYSPNVTATLGADGTYTIVVKATDISGNSTTYSVTVKLQTAGPTISASLSSPQSSIGYDGTADITISASATDPTGVTSISYKVDGTTTLTSNTIDIDTLLAGTHTVVVTAVDGLGNSSSMTLTFQIHPTRSGINNAVVEGTNNGQITAVEEVKLQSILNNALNSLKTDLQNFITECQAQSGQSITVTEANILISWAQDLYNRS